MADRTIVPAGFAQVTWHYRLPGDPEDMLTSMGFDVNTDPMNEVDVLALTNAWATWQAPLVGGNCEIVQADVVIGDNNPPYVVQNYAVSGVGFSGSDSAPPNTALLVKKITGRAGRQGRGRSFVPCVIGAQVDSAGFLDTADVATANADLATFMLGFPYGVFLAPVLLHNDASPGPATPDEITSLVLQLKVATQRRRLRP